jgi:hypothetical protein
MTPRTAGISSLGSAVSLFALLLVSTAAVCGPRIQNGDGYRTLLGHWERKPCQRAAASNASRFLRANATSGQYGPKRNPRSRIVELGLAFVGSEP